MKNRNKTKLIIFTSSILFADRTSFV